MVDLKLDLLIDRCSSDDSDLDKWISFIEKYLKFGLEQKGLKVNVVKWLNSESETWSLYVPVFTRKALNSEPFMETTKQKFESGLSTNFIKIGLIKEGSVADKIMGMFPDVKFLRMYLLDGDTGDELADKELWKKENNHSFLFKIFDLCNEVEREIQNKINSSPSAVKKAVYLADASPDLLMVREEIRRELLRQGFEVYPEKPVVGNVKEVEKKITEFLQKSVLSVHLFGKFYQETKPGEVQKVELENKIAANFYLNRREGRRSSVNPFKRVIWMPDNLTITNELQSKFISQVQRDKNLYAGAEIIRSSVEELKDILLEKLTKDEPVKVGGGNSDPSATINDKRLVYVVISEKNREGAEAMKNMLESIGHEVLLDDGKRKFKKDKLKNIDSVLFYYQNEQPSWLRSRMCEVYKHNTWEVSSTYLKKGIINFEKQELPSDDIFKDVVQIEADQELEYQNLMSFFSQSVLK